MRLKFLLVFLVLFFSPASASAYSNPGQPAGFVNDFANLLSPEVKAQLESDLSNFEKQTKHEIAVVTIPDLQGDTIENFSVKLFEEWGIGKKGADNGVLFLIARDDRKMRIEVGYGLEGALTDAQAFWLIENIAKPSFRNNDYEGGILQTIAALEKSIQGEEVNASAGVKKTPVRNWGELVIYGFFVLMFIGNFIVHLFSRSKRWWPGGVWGGILGLALGLGFFGLAIKTLLAILGLGALGLGLDYWASKRGPFDKGGRGGGPLFFGGFGGRGGFGGGGFGGFGGGRSGGGGASGGW